MPRWEEQSYLIFLNGLCSEEEAADCNTVQVLRTGLGTGGQRGLCVSVMQQWCPDPSAGASWMCSLTSAYALAVASCAKHKSLLRDVRQGRICQPRDQSGKSSGLGTAAELAKRKS